MKVHISLYNPSWPEAFQSLKNRLDKILASVEPIIHHIGSTSVVNLPAKPVIDVLIGVSNMESADASVKYMTAAGFSYISTYEDVMPERRFFILDEAEERKANIHLVPLESKFYVRHLLFRDYLRNNEEVRDAYRDLKLDLAVKEWKSGNDYSDAKNSFIREIERLAFAGK